MMQGAEETVEAAEVMACVRRTLDGDPAAFEPLIERYERLVWHVISRYLLNADEADDVFQRTFLEAYRSLDTWQEGRSFANWLCGIARNQCRMARRSQAITARHLTAYRQQLETANPVPEPERPEILALRRCQEDLGGDAAKLLRLRYEEGLDFTAIAASIGRTVGATRRLASRLRDQLRQCIEHRTGMAG